MTLATDRGFWVTVLEALDGPLTKRVTLRDGMYHKEQLPKPSMFLRHVSPEVCTVQELANLLQQIELIGTYCVVTGAPNQAISLDQPVRRLKHDRPGHAASLVEQASPLHPIDLDGLYVSGVDVVRNSAEAAKAAVRSLGDAFGAASFYYQFTAGQRPDSTSLRLRLWFITDHWFTNEERKRWAHTLLERGFPVDAAIYQAAQPIYTAAPQFVDCDDPLPRRSGFVHGVIDRVQLVIPPGPIRTVRTVRTVTPGASLDCSLSHARVRHVLHLGVAWAREFKRHGGRHHTLMKVALSGRRCGLSAEEINCVCREVARVLPVRDAGPIPGSEVESIVDWCVQHVPQAREHLSRRGMLSARWRAVGAHR